jgi:hypothetical protein
MKAGRLMVEVKARMMSEITSIVTQKSGVTVLRA